VFDGSRQGCLFKFLAGFPVINSPTLFVLINHENEMSCLNSKIKNRQDQYVVLCLYFELDQIDEEL
jgi:hypothetical protein